MVCRAQHLFFFRSDTILVSTTGHVYIEVQVELYSYHFFFFCECNCSHMNVKKRYIYI